MRILIATPYYYPQTGGLENYAQQIAKGLLAKGHHVAVVCGDTSISQQTTTQLDGYTVYRLPIWKVFSNTPVHPGWPTLLKTIIAQEKADIIDVHAPVVFMVDMIALVAGRIPVVITYHAATLTKPASAVVAAVTSAYGVAQKLTFRKARHIIAVSDYVKNCLPPSVQAKTSVITNAVPSVAPARRKPGTGLVFVANLEPTHTWKGLDLILEALHILKQQGQTVPPLTVIGDGADRSRYEADVKQLGLSGQVSFAGRLTGAARDQQVAKAAAMILYPTTANDAFPTVMLEAWSLGLAVIAAAIGPMPSLVADGQTGLLTPANNPAALAETIRRYANDPARLQRIGEAGRRHVAAAFTWPHIVSQTEALLEQLV